MQHTLSRIAIIAARLAGTAALIIGLMLWFGQGGALIHAHMGTGALLVLALWLLGVLALKAKPGAAILALVWGVVTLALGIFQGVLLPGEYHWVVQAGHLLVGISAIVLTEKLAAALGAQRAAQAPQAA